MMGGGTGAGILNGGGATCRCTGGGGGRAGLGPCITVTEGTSGGGRRSVRSIRAKCSDGRMSRGGVVRIATAVHCSGIWVRGRGSGGREESRGGGGGARRTRDPSASSAIGARQSGEGYLKLLGLLFLNW